MSVVRIDTTQAGSLPRTPALLDANAARTRAADGFTLTAGEDFDGLVARAVDEVVQHQVDAGVTIVGDGEFGKAMARAVDYQAWWSYAFQRVAGLSLTDETPYTHATRSTDGIRLGAFNDRRDRTRFADAYREIMAERGTQPFPSVTAPLRYIGQDAVGADVAHLRAALDARGLQDGFITSVAPGSMARIVNQHYTSDREYLWAWAEALREEYRAIIDGGLVLQLDDPALAESWDQISPEPALEDYLAFSRESVEALNWALEGLPQDRIRYHLCWGSWHGPHTTDLPFRDIIGLMLEVNAGQYTFEAANARHEHEWRLWEDVALPEGKKILPGVVGHATNVVEHPELVADRIERFARLVGPENVIASTDCGLGGRIHPQIAWAKLEALSEGARLASERF